MVKEFNTTGSCNPAIHYMVDTSEKLKQIEELVNKGKYFTINRARQYGKTTTLDLLLKRLSPNYTVYQISFETDGDLFESGKDFCRGLAMKLSRAAFITEEQSKYWRDHNNCSNLDDLSVVITDFCKAQNKKVVLMIDEVDKSTDNQIFLHFLGMLRNKYLDRAKNGMDSTFHSVILAGVYDVKNLKLKIRREEERKYNSPWNVATDFLVDMNFNVTEIKAMLSDYENDHKTGMDIQLVSEEIHRLTNGYPFLVSKICEIIDQRLSKDWSLEGVNKAAKEIILGNNTLADDISKNLGNNQELKEFMYSISVNGEAYTYNLTDEIMKIADMFAYIKNVNGQAVIHNAIFEEIFHQYFTIGYQRAHTGKILVTKSEYIINGKLNMEYVIQRFKDLIEDEYRDEDAEFLERQGRLLFLCYLKPIINGTGFYYVEPETRDNKRMDIIVTYNNEEFLIELKLWYGTKYERKGEEQVSEYANIRGLKKAYLITFAFLKEKLVQKEAEWKNVNGVDVYEGIVWAKKR